MISRFRPFKAILQKCIQSAPELVPLAHVAPRMPDRDIGAPNSVLEADTAIPDMRESRIFPASAAAEAAAVLIHQA